ncbi:DNA-binding response regulator, partial [Desulfobacteraceae bacterium SEEP-SAG9]
GRGGIDILKQLKIKKPEIPVLVLRMYPEDQYAVRAIKAGASGYLTKESAPEELIGAIKKVAQGGKYVSTDIAEKLVENLGKDTEKPDHTMLSDREY